MNSITKQNIERVDFNDVIFETGDMLKIYNPNESIQGRFIKINSFYDDDDYIVLSIKLDCSEKYYSKFKSVILNVNTISVEKINVY